MPSATKRKRPGFRSNIMVGGPGLDADGLRHAAESNPETFQRRTHDLINDPDQPLRMRHVTDLRKLFLSLGDVQVPVRVPIMGETRTVMASAFPVMIGGMVVAGLEDVQEGAPTIGQELVRDMEDNKKISIYARAFATKSEGKDRTDEGEPYPEIGAGEEKYEIRHHREGYQLSVTSEAVEENDVANVDEKINSLREIASEEIEEQTVRRVCDIDGSGTSPAEPYVLRRNGAGSALYSTSANTPGVRAPSGTRIESNALVDDTDLDAARTRLVAMLNDRGKRLSVSMSQMTLLVPDALLGVASTITNSDFVPGTVNEVANWGPRGQHRPRLLSSPKLDDLSTTTWYLGNFVKQFTRKWKLKFEYVTLAGNTLDFLTRRIAFRARIGWDCEIGAVDYARVVQCLAGTTAP